MSRSSNNRIEISSVALVDLKAEISRRQIEVRQKSQTLPEGCTVIKSSNTNEKRSIWRKSKPTLKDHEPVPTDSQDSEETKRLEYIKKRLEAKAKLYEALRAAAASGSESHSKNRLNFVDNEDILIDFEEKVKEEMDLQTSSDSLHSDLNEVSQTNQMDDHSYEVSDKRQRIHEHSGFQVESEPLLRGDDPLTYAHLREGEIRDHGVGFYAFSQDAAKREFELARLKELHRATEEGRARAEAIRAKRDARMGQRLARLRARKGLPDVATAAAQCLKEVSAPPTPLPVSADAQSDINLGSDDLDVASMLRRLRDEAERQVALNKPVAEVNPIPEQRTTLADIAAKGYTFEKRREWDKGKSMVSAERYLEEERNRRNQEFAPPYHH